MLALGKWGAPGLPWEGRYRSIRVTGATGQRGQLQVKFLREGLPSPCVPEEGFALTLCSWGVGGEQAPGRCAHGLFGLWAAGPPQSPLWGGAAWCCWACRAGSGDGSVLSMGERKQMTLLPCKGVAGAEVGHGARLLALHVPERSEPSRQQLWLWEEQVADGSRRHWHGTAFSICWYVQWGELVCSTCVRGFRRKGDLATHWELKCARMWGRFRGELWAAIPAGHPAAGRAQFSVLSLSFSSAWCSATKGHS